MMILLRQIIQFIIYVEKTILENKALRLLQHN